MYTRVFVLGACAFFAATAATAAPQITGSLGYSFADQNDAKLGLVQARLGARFTPNLGLEGEIGYGVADDTVDSCAPPILCFAAATSKVEAKMQAAIYAVGYLPVSPKADLFIRAGYGTNKLDVTPLTSPTVVPSPFTLDDSGFAIGGGGQYFWGQNGVRADYTRWEQNGSANVWSISYVRKFN